MTASTAISKIDPLVSTPEVCLHTRPNTEMPHARQILRASEPHNTRPTRPIWAASVCSETAFARYNTHNLWLRAVCSSDCDPARAALCRFESHGAPDTILTFCGRMSHGHDGIHEGR